MRHLLDVFRDKLEYPRLKRAAASLYLVWNPREREKALQVLDVQAGSGIVVPDNVLIEPQKAARHGTADYEALAERMDRAISKVAPDHDHR